MTNTKQPLYKQLNELRTQGEWVINKNIPAIITKIVPDDGGDIIHKVPVGWEASTKRWKYNAEYTCLAVNNLHHLAEALQPLKKLADAVFEDTKQDKQGVLYAFNSAEITYEDLRKAKEALNRIS